MMIELYVVMAISVALFLARCYETYFSYREGIVRVAVLMRDMFFMFSHTILIALFGGAMLKVSKVDCSPDFWGLIAYPILLGAGTLLNYLLFFLLDIIIPKSKMEKYPLFPVIFLILAIIFATLSTSAFIISK